MYIYFKWLSCFYWKLKILKIVFQSWHLLCSIWTNSCEINKHVFLCTLSYLYLYIIYTIMKRAMCPIPIQYPVFSSIQYPVSSIFQYPVSSIFQYPVSNIQYPISSIQYPISSIQYPVSSIQYPVSSIQYPISSIQYPVYSTQYLVSSIQNPVYRWV